jgi:voltage-gated potassium channel
MARVLRSVLAVIGMLVVYSVFPVPGAGTPPVLAWVVFVAGMAVLVWAVALIVRRAQDPHDDVGVRFEGLAALLYIVIAFFSLVYLGLSLRANEFVGLHDRIDALYFTMSTLSTVGYGDVHPSGQVARLVVTVQLAFDLVFLGVLARLVVPALARRRQGRFRDTETE